MRGIQRAVFMLLSRVLWLRPFLSVTVLCGRIRQADGLGGPPALLTARLLDLRSVIAARCVSGPLAGLEQAPWQRICGRHHRPAAGPAAYGARLLSAYGRRRRFDAWQAIPGGGWA